MNRPYYFGTDGIRAHQSDYRLQHRFLYAFGRALVMWVKSHYGDIIPHILIGRDTRLSGEKLKQSIAMGIAAEHGLSTDGGILPTPALYSLLQSKTRYQVSIALTASHNPYHDNGIKIFTRSGKLTDEDELQLSALITPLLGEKIPPEPEISDYMPNINAINNELEQSYLDRIREFFPQSFLDGLTIALDCAHGAFFNCAPFLLREYGARLIPIGVEPNGKNINLNTGSLYPEALQECLISSQADFGISFDGDGDRLTLITHTGEILTGDHILYLLQKHPLYKESKKIVGTIMSNSGLEQALQKEHKQLIRTPVGDKYVSEELKRQNVQLGGENSGHIIMSDYIQSSDALFTSLRAIETALITHNRSLRTYQDLPQVSTKIPVSHKPDVTTLPCYQEIQAIQKKLSPGRAVIRYSGTEPVLRVMVEHEDKNNALYQLEVLRKLLIPHLLEITEKNQINLHKQPGQEQTA